MIPLSVLELATVGSQQSSAESLAAATELAVRTEQLGYHRFWVAEHHNMPAVASTSPPVLIAHLAAHTSRLRIGSGGVMLPNHAPYVVAEQFAMLEALHPGRIDLGIGRAPGTDQRTALALRRDVAALGAEDFPQHLLDLMALLGDNRIERGLADYLTATPAPESSPSIMLLGSSGFSAQLAGMLGLPFAFAHHFSGQNTDEAVALYRQRFTPSVVLDAPYLIVTAAALAAESDQRAEELALPGQLMMLGIRTNRLRPIPSLEEALADPQRDAAAAMRGSRIIGSSATVRAGLTELAERTGADELMVSTTTHGLDERLASYELIAGEWGLIRSAA